MKTLVGYLTQISLQTLDRSVPDSRRTQLRSGPWTPWNTLLLYGENMHKIEKTTVEKVASINDHFGDLFYFNFISYDYGEYAGTHLLHLNHTGNNMSLKQP